MRPSRPISSLTSRSAVVVISSPGSQIPETGAQFPLSARWAKSTDRGDGGKKELVVADFLTQGQNIIRSGHGPYPTGSQVVQNLREDCFDVRGHREGHFGASTVRTINTIDDRIRRAR